MQVGWLAQGTVGWLARRASSSWALETAQLLPNTCARRSVADFLATHPAESTEGVIGRLAEKLMADGRLFPPTQAMCQCVGLPGCSQPARWERCFAAGRQLGMHAADALRHACRAAAESRAGCCQTTSSGCGRSTWRRAQMRPRGKPRTGGAAGGRCGSRAAGVLWRPPAAGPLQTCNAHLCFYFFSPQVRPHLWHVQNQGRQGGHAPCTHCRRCSCTCSPPAGVPAAPCVCCNCLPVFPPCLFLFFCAGAAHGCRHLPPRRVALCSGEPSAPLAHPPCARGTCVAADAACPLLLPRAAGLHLMQLGWVGSRQFLRFMRGFAKEQCGLFLSSHRWGRRAGAPQWPVGPVVSSALHHGTALPTG